MTANSIPVFFPFHWLSFPRVRGPLNSLFVTREYSTFRSGAEIDDFKPSRPFPETYRTHSPSSSALVPCTPAQTAPASQRRDFDSASGSRSLPPFDPLRHTVASSLRNHNSLASLRYRQKAFAIRICSGVLHSGSNNGGEQTKMLNAFAREVATFNRFSE